MKTLFVERLLNKESLDKFTIKAKNYHKIEKIIFQINLS
jgi:hypothetical protein